MLMDFHLRQQQSGLHHTSFRPVSKRKQCSQIYLGLSVRPAKKFCSVGPRKTSDWPSLQPFNSPMTSQIFLSAPPLTSMMPLHRDKSEPAISSYPLPPLHDSTNFHRRSFCCGDERNGFDFLTKAASLNQSSFTITTNPLSASGQEKIYFETV